MEASNEAAGNVPVVVLPFAMRMVCMVPQALVAVCYGAHFNSANWELGLGLPQACWLDVLERTVLWLVHSA
jgi:hypothetical protein